MTEGNSLARSIERHMGCAGVPGLSAALVERDRVVWTEGFGRCRDESGDRISAETVVPAAAAAAASCSPWASSR